MVVLMTKKVMNSARPVRIWFEGVVAMPSAWRRIDSTMMMRVNAVIASSVLWAIAAPQGSSARIGRSPKIIAAIGAIRDRRHNIRLTRNHHSRSWGAARPLHHVPQALGECRRLGGAILDHAGHGQ